MTQNNTALLNQEDKEGQHGQDDPFKQTQPPADLPVSQDRLKATINIYEDSIMVYTFDGTYTWTKCVSADDLAQAFTMHAAFPSGILPPDTLWTKHTPTGLVTAVYREARIWPAALQTEPLQPPKRYQLPMPPLIFIHSQGKTPHVFAAKNRPTSERQELYHSPTFNTFNDGQICPGTHRFPNNPGEIPESFFESYFSMTGNQTNRSQSHPYRLIDLWEQINGQKEYPLEDLVPIHSVQTAMEIPRRRS